MRHQLLGSRSYTPFHLVYDLTGMGSRSFDSRNYRVYGPDVNQ